MAYYAYKDIEFEFSVEPFYVYNDDIHINELAGHMACILLAVGSTTIPLNTRKVVCSKPGIPIIFKTEEAALDGAFQYMRKMVDNS